MSQVVVRNLEEGIKEGLKQRAAQHGWSMEEEARQILRKAVLVDTASSVALGSRIAARFAGCGLVEDLPEVHGQVIVGMDFPRMIILDTNVLSALMRSEPDAAVVSWLDAQVSESIWITSITLFEARFGLALLPDGARRQQLTARFDDLLASDLENRVLLFDQPAARQAAELAAQRQRAGRRVDMRDSFIAGIALARKARIATRNPRHFDDLPEMVIDPWKVA